jgi:hypothetical protein
MESSGEPEDNHLHENSVVEKSDLSAERRWTAASLFYILQSQGLLFLNIYKNIL